LVTPYQNSAYNPPSEPGLPAKSLPSKAIMRATQIMQSIGELGYIHTPNSWQYLKLQPNGGGGAIPDWAVLDMFTVGAAVPNVTSGRININSFINPDPTPAVRAPVTPRLVPLEALLNTVISPPLTVAGHIYEDDTTIRTDTYGMKDSFGNGIFDTIGELCEVPSLANSATTEAGKEAVIRRIANLITVRSNTFTIWVIAQSIKEPNVGALQTFGTFQPTVDLITGEVRAQAVVERYENPIGTGPFFRTKYFRYIYQ
jgi:hypothetical protein